MFPHVRLSDVRKYLLPRVTQFDCLRLVEPRDFKDLTNSSLRYRAKVIFVLYNNKSRRKMNKSGKVKQFIRVSIVVEVLSAWLQSLFYKHLSQAGFIQNSFFSYQGSKKCPEPKNLMTGSDVFSLIIHDTQNCSFSHTAGRRKLYDPSKCRE